MPTGGAGDISSLSLELPLTSPHHRSSFHCQYIEAKHNGYHITRHPLQKGQRSGQLKRSLGSMISFNRRGGVAFCPGDLNPSSPSWCSSADCIDVTPVTFTVSKADRLYISAWLIFQINELRLFLFPVRIMASLLSVYCPRLSHCDLPDCIALQYSHFQS